MINYLKSESYRLLRKKGPHLTSIICFALIAAAAAVLYFSGQADPNFRYATSKFFYSNAIGAGIMIIIVGLVYNSFLTGKDLTLMKQSISFGISRNTIFWSKLILTLSYFLLICVVGIILMAALGENLFAGDNQAIRNFLLACVNMAPLVLSGFFLTHTLKMLRVGDVYIIIVLFFIFVLSGNMLRVFQPISGLNELYKYAPNTLLNDNLMGFLDDTVRFDYKYWCVGIVISVISLLIGAKKFANKNID
ncbi:ABC transporter permease [Neobacillus piezotolerans]|uniref:ABC transporter permease n=1 Tax=Neobacillus piezotolerans TaxID=2259171 RepID=A0A3D8GSC7_9BACI|nr:ABC transporter permease [Neobacillus piezotolerans]RDU37202.1 ABC transporter permease [Neobacillus piezotolerans]